MNRYASYAGTILGFGLGYVTFQSYPSVFFLLLGAFLLYWISKRIIIKIAKQDATKDKSRQTLLYILAGLGGVLGLISPINGYMLALPGYLIASELITNKYKNKKKLLSISAIATAICIINAVLGAFFATSV